MNDVSETLEMMESGSTLWSTGAQALPGWAPVRRAWLAIPWGRLLLFVASLWLFVLAITLMKTGARPLAPYLQTGLSITNPFNSLGFGWLFAYVIMSGSPVAAAALTFFEAGALDVAGTFTMITGSRLGASFIVLFIGFVYVWRGRDRVQSLGMGLLSLLVTGTTYLAGLGVGLALLQSGWLATLQPGPSATLRVLTAGLFDPLTGRLQTWLPGWMLFVIGLGVIVFSFHLFDRCLPHLGLAEDRAHRLATLTRRPGVMFLLGTAVTLVSMSVSVSLGILVPLSQQGLVRRENVIPYIMGANISTFIDTLLAAMLMHNPAAFTVVLAEMCSIALVSLLLLATCYRRYQQAMLALVHWITTDRLHLAFFMVTILLVPLGLLLL